LGCTSFGGPAAHIGYFRKVFVEQLHWLNETSYARLIALSQFLPGPGSSQVGFAIGLRRGGLWGGAAGFIAFTFPSFLSLYFLSSAGGHSNPYFANVIHGLKLLAVVVVADATLSMFNSFCQERLAVALAVLTAITLLLLPSLWSQIGVLALAALVGTLHRKPVDKPPENQSAFKPLPFILFLVFFVGLPLVAATSQWIDLFFRFYQAGSLVFGGGHVVLPLLQQATGELVPTDRFLLGYAAAQAIPGPMFALAAFLGSELAPSDRLLGALIATAGIFLPGFLLVISLQDAWQSWANHPTVAGAAWGINAAVVGLLLAALYRPVFVSAVSEPMEMALVILGLFALRALRLPILFLVLGFAVTGLGLYFY
jgi:chromate transporter